MKSSKKAMSEKSKQQSLEVRGRVVGMVEADKRQHDVAKALEVSLRTVQRWWAQYKRKGSVQKRKSSGCPKGLGRAQKVVISKSIGKNGKAIVKWPKICQKKPLRIKGYYTMVFEDGSWFEALPSA